MSQITEFKISWKLTGFIGISEKVRFSCNQQLRVYFLWEEQANQRQITLKFIDEIKVCQLITIPKGAMGAKSCALVFVLQTKRLILKYTTWTLYMGCYWKSQVKEIKRVCETPLG